MLDSAGDLFVVDKLEGVSYPPPFWGWSLVFARAMIVRWWVSHERTVSLAEATNLLVHRGFRDPEARVHSMEFRAKDIRGKQSIGELLDAFLEVY